MHDDHRRTRRRRFTLALQVGALVGGILLLPVRYFLVRGGACAHGQRLAIRVAVQDAVLVDDEHYFSLLLAVGEFLARSSGVSNLGSAPGARLVGSVVAGAVLALSASVARSVTIVSTLPLGAGA